MFLSGTFNGQPIESVDPQPLLVDDLRSVAVTLVQPGMVKEEFLKHHSWALVQPEDWEDMSFVLSSFVLKDPTSVCLFGFDMLPLIRRINGALAQRSLATIPAYLWAGTTSRSYDIMRYLAADPMTTPAELLRHLGVKCLPIYQPHRDLREDQGYLLELAVRFGLITERVDMSGLTSLPLVIPGKADAPDKPIVQKKRKVIEAA
jgi:hypothetical protein